MRKGNLRAVLPLQTYPNLEYLNFAERPERHRTALERSSLCMIPRTAMTIVYYCHLVYAVTGRQMFFAALSLAKSLCSMTCPGVSSALQAKVHSQ